MLVCREANGGRELGYEDQPIQNIAPRLLQDDAADGLPSLSGPRRKVTFNGNASEQSEEDGDGQLIQALRVSPTILNPEFQTLLCGGRRAADPGPEGQPHNPKP